MMTQRLIPAWVFTLLLAACAWGGESDFPTAGLSNRFVSMKLYLPDSTNGYYRAARFDWSGVVYSLKYRGHEYYGEWNTDGDPLAHDHITGPVESFDGEGAGYREAPVGGAFLRIGVGLLEKENDGPYVWNHPYRIIDHGKWTVQQGDDWIEFIQQLDNQAGWSCRYTKRIVLTTNGPGFSISHALENTGRNRITTRQFNHNFFVIDQTPSGPDFVVEVPFPIRLEEGDESSRRLVEIQGSRLCFPKQFNSEKAWLNLAGFGNTASDHQVKILNRKTGAGVELKVDKPLCRLVLWVHRNTICPENFVNLDVAPGETVSWRSDYSLFIENPAPDAGGITQTKGEHR